MPYGRTYDIRVLHCKVAARGTGGYGHGNIMHHEVRDEPCHAWLELNVWPVRVLRCVALC